jgi:hypothetical protein
MTTLRARFSLAVLALALVPILGGCTVFSVESSGSGTTASVDEVPAGKVRAPDATGTIDAVHLSDGPVSIAFRPDAGFEYFAGTTFNVSPSAFPHGEDGVTLVASDLSVGARINVWVSACRESSPVDCDVERVELAP